MPSSRWILRLLPLVTACVFTSGCLFWPKAGEKGPTTRPSRLQVVSFSDPIKAVASNDAISLRGARNETVSVSIQINEFPRMRGKRPYGLRIGELRMGDSAVIPPASYGAYQVLPMPIDTKRASFIRQTGIAPAGAALPRALLPLAMEDGTIRLSSLRNANRPTDANSAADDDEAPSPIVFVDIQIPPTAAPGDYYTECQLIEAGTARSSTWIKLTVDDYVIPDQRHLLMVGMLDWASLARLYPEQFAGVRPNLVSRTEPKHAAAVRTLDEMIKLAQSHRAQLVVDRLQPTVKWPSGRPPQIDWREFDSVVGPWLKGDVFPDLVPLGYWPLPVPDHLEAFDAASQSEYWIAAATHFDQLGWLSRSAVPLESRSGGRVGLIESVELSEQAARILAIHPRIRVSVPLEEEQVQVASPSSPRRIAPESLDRVLYVARGVVSAPPLQRLPEGAGTRWLRTDLPGLIPYSGAGADEREVRLWAWLAFLRQAELIQWSSVLPGQKGPGVAADPDALVWFYPGSWFGVGEPVPTLQLKWLRRAQQDYEYLWLARQRGQLGRAMLLSRLISKPVEIPPTQLPDPVYGLLSGSSDQQTWGDAVDLLSQIMLLSQPGQAVDPAAERQLGYQMTAWSKKHERPLLLGRSAEWRTTGDGSHGVELRLGVDIYNAAEQQPERNRLHWTVVPDGWLTNIPPVEVPQLGTYSVNRFYLNTRINLDQVTVPSNMPVKVTFTDGFTGRSYPAPMVLPVAYSEQRQGPAPRMDGSLDDWAPEDALCKAPLVLMYDKPTVQQQQIQFAATPAAVYSTWTAASLYLGFRVEGADWPLANLETSFVNYQLRRAWGEDVCEALIQPVYADNSLGPLLHVACKPRGQLEISRRLNPRLHASPWQAFAASDVRYAGTIAGTVWRGEIAIPWDAINDTDHQGKRPALLRFNFAQHRGRTGRSASWAGPVDFARDEQFMGVLEIR